MTPYTVEEKDLLMEELSNLEKLMNKKEDLKQEINHLRRIFMQMKDVRPTIKKAREMCLNDIELFEMKNFLIYSEQARSEANYVNGQTKMTGLGYMDLEAALDILDPDGRRIPSFYIYEAYSEKLDDIRKQQAGTGKIHGDCRRKRQRKSIRICGIRLFWKRKKKNRSSGNSSQNACSRIWMPCSITPM